MTTEQIETGIRIGAVVNGIAQTLRAQAATA